MPTITVDHAETCIACDGLGHHVYAKNPTHSDPKTDPKETKPKRIEPKAVQHKCKNCDGTGVLSWQEQQVNE